MVVAISSLVPENVNVEGPGGSRQRFLRNKLLVANGAPDEMPFAILPFAFGGRIIDPSLGDLLLALKRSAYVARLRVDVGSAESRQTGSIVNHAVCKLNDFRSIAPTTAMGVNHPWSETKSTFTRS